MASLSHNVDYVKATTAYVTMTRTELISAPASWTQCVFQRFFFISLRNLNQLDAISKVMYRHEIICTGNKVYLTLSLWNFLHPFSHSLRNYFFDARKITGMVTKMGYLD